MAEMSLAGRLAARIGAGGGGLAGFAPCAPRNPLAVADLAGMTSLGV
jgi:hypothetical protein